MKRLEKTVEEVISPVQTAFIKGRFIMEGVTVLHEILNSIHSEKSNAVLFKVDFEKVYDKIKWPFVCKMLKLEGYPDIWIDWILKLMRGGHVAIKVNEMIGKYFITHKGLRQGDPMSPLLFDLAADALAIVMEKAKTSGLIKGLLHEAIEGGINMLQYTDDTIFLLPDDIEIAKRLKFILCAFEQMSGLNINFHKSGKLLKRMKNIKEFLPVRMAPCR